MKKEEGTVLLLGHDPIPPVAPHSSPLQGSDNIRFLTLLFAFLSITFFITSSSTAIASNQQPEEVQAAIVYFQKLKKNKIKLSRDTALSKHCSQARRKEIKEQLTFFSKTHLDPDDSFTLEKTKTIGNLAAVLLKTQNSTTPLSIRVYAVALIRRDQQWLPAPLPGRFTNTGYGYDPTVEKNVILLEDWMASQKVILKSQARKTAEQNLIASIKKEEVSAKLPTLSPQQAISYFIQQCRQKNLIGVLACLGAASVEINHSLASTVKNISNGLGATKLDNTWQLVTNPAVIAYTFEKIKKKQEIAVGFWNPLIQNHLQILYFPIPNSEEKAWVKLPQRLILTMLSKEERWNFNGNGLVYHANESELKKKLVSNLFKKIPKLKFSQSPEKLSNAFLAALETGDFTHAFQLLPHQGEYFEDSDHQKKMLIQLSQLWKNLYSLRNNPHQNFPLITQDTLALLPLQYAKPNHPGKFDAVNIWFLQDSDGWHLIPEETISDLKDSKLKSQQKAIKSSMLNLVKKRQDSFSKKLLSQVTILTPPLKLPAPDDQIAQELLTSFRADLRAKETVSALSQCAILKGANNTKTLKTFNYALHGAADQTSEDHILKINRSGPWVGISLRTQSKASKAYDYPLYLIIATSNGPKVLLDIDLRYATNKGRKLLNDRNWKKLEQILPAPSLTHLKKLFAKHEIVSKADIDSHEK